jgi:type 1 fimbria pilin
LQNITSIQLKPVYIKNRKTNAAPGTGDMTATATLTVE